MLFNSNRLNSSTNFLASAVFLLSVFFCVQISEASAQGTTDKKSNLPVWQSYKGVNIGMTTDEVRQKLGAPKTEEAGDLSYVFSSTETAEFIIDADKKVRAVTVMFSEDHQNPPKFEEVFGKTATAEPKADGAVYKLVRFPAAGYWVSYSRLGGEKAMVIVMIQKI